jgi:hypothetical protein
MFARFFRSLYRLFRKHLKTRGFHGLIVEAALLIAVLCAAISYAHFEITRLLIEISHR